MELSQRVAKYIVTDITTKKRGQVQNGCMLPAET